MKWPIIQLILLAVLAHGLLYAQSTLPYQGTEICDQNGKKISFSSLFDEHQPLIVFFWNSAEGRSCQTVLDLCELSQDHLHIPGPRLVTIVMDNEVNTQMVKPLVAGKGIDLAVYTDHNGSARRQFGITRLPFLVAFDANGKILWKQSCTPGTDVKMVCEKVQQLFH
ncbi:MAG: TlpA family protein disulfide reductase [Bacteroidetes bacterium]|nr:TlpA family protein disulfide reductase [Bacteroidota bacterium]